MKIKLPGNAAISEPGGRVVSALDFHAEVCGFEPRPGRDNFQNVNIQSSYGQGG